MPRQQRIGAITYRKNVKNVWPQSESADTNVTMAYRAETALVARLHRHLNKKDEARALVRALFVSSADLAPDAQAKTLTVKIHRMASPVHDRAIAAVLSDLNELNFCHPETGDGLVYSLV